MVTSSTTIDYRIRYNQVSSSHSALTALQLIKFQVCPCLQPSRRWLPVTNTKTTTRLSAMSSARRRKSSAYYGLSVVVASRLVEMLGNDTDDESKEFSPSHYLKYRLENSCDAKQSDRQSDAGQDWVRYSETPSRLTSPSRGDDEDINYQLKFMSDSRKIMVQSSTSYLFIPLPPQDKECVNILRDHVIN
jgi:hypothetical protein